MKTLWQFIRISFQKRPFTILSLFFLFSALIFQLRWSPTPNIVEVSVSGLDQENTSRLLQIYYQYDIKYFRGFKEHQSSTALIHRSHQPLHATFDLPGLQSLGDLRLDFGIGFAALKIHQISLYYNFFTFKFKLFTINPRQLATLWSPNDGVRVIDVNDDFLKIEVSGYDPFAVITINPSDWKDAVPLADLRLIKIMRILLIIVAYTIFILGFKLTRSEWLNKAGTTLTPIWNRSVPLIFLIGMALLGLFVYWPYLACKNLYLFADVANDSVSAFWPIYIHLAEYLRSENWPLWSFSLGTGKGIYDLLTDPFTLLHMQLPSDMFAFGFGWIQYFKVIIAAGLFFFWFRLLHIGRFASLFAATGLAFSAHMIIRGNWIHYATEVVVVAFALCAIEIFLKKRIWYFVPFALVLLIARGVFHTYVWTIILLSYVCCRLWIFYGNQFKYQANALLKLIALYCVGLLVSAAILLPNLYSLLQSARLSSEDASLGNFGAYLFLNDPRQWLSALYGLFAPDLLGRGNFYTGWRNYLEGPHLYTGLFVLLLLPQVFFRRSNRLRIVIVLALSASIAYIFLPWVRYGLNGFSGIYFKTSSFWISILFSCCAALALDNAVQHRVLNLWLLTATFLFCQFSLFLLKFSPFIQSFVRIGEHTLTYQQVITILTFYYIFLIFLRFRNLRPYGLILLICTLFLEVLLFAGGSNQNREALRGDTQKTGGFYYDNSLLAVNKIKKLETLFYRIEKTAPTVSFNDALAQGYFGLKSYVSFNSSPYLRFLGKNGFDIDYRHKNIQSTARVKGLDNHYILETLLSVKYYISLEENRHLVPQNYKFIDRQGKYLIFENANFIPFGFVYHTLFTETAALQLQPMERELLALESAIVTDEIVGLNSLTTTSEDTIVNLNMLSANIDSTDTVEYFVEKSKELSQSAMQTLEYSQNKFNGLVSLDQPGLLFLSIPAEKGWIFLVNNVEIEPVRTHFGFYGIILPAGSFRISAQYFPPLLSTGLCLSLIGIVIYMFLIVITRYSIRLETILLPLRKAELE